jgi:hypothetical protein
MGSWRLPAATQCGRARRHSARCCDAARARSSPRDKGARSPFTGAPEPSSPGSSDGRAARGKDGPRP